MSQNLRSAIIEGVDAKLSFETPVTPNVMLFYVTNAIATLDHVFSTDSPLIGADRYMLNGKALCKTGQDTNMVIEGNTNDFIYPSKEFTISAPTEYVYGLLFMANYASGRNISESLDQLTKEEKSHNRQLLLNLAQYGNWVGQDHQAVRNGILQNGGEALFLEDHVTIPLIHTEPERNDFNTITTSDFYRTLDDFLKNSGNGISSNLSTTNGDYQHVIAGMNARYLATQSI
jgi:hypothetical protein